MTNKIIIGDVRETSKQLEDNSIQVVNTSPPYFNLRNYNNNENQFGLEATQDEFIRNLVDLFVDIKPKLKSTATLWINVGDSVIKGSQQLIPERFAIEMVRSGFKLINQVVWHKPSAMPCSAKRRMGIDYEKIYLFAVNDDYLFNMMKHPYKTATIKRAESFLKNNEANRKGTSKYNLDNDGQQDCYDVLKRSYSKIADQCDRAMPPIGGKKHLDNDNDTYSGNTPDYKEGANTRCVWIINPSRNKDKHFATQAPEISRRAILMGSNEGDLVYDPFHGLGTTMKQAVDNKRNYIGTELNRKYVEDGLEKWNIEADIKEQ